MKVKVDYLYNSLTTLLLSILGFSSCDVVKEEPCLYGTPTTKYYIKGRVTDTDGKPINGIKVGENTVYDNVSRPQSIPIYTNEKGEYITAMNSTSSIDVVEVTFEDIDGEENGGAFVNDTLKVTDMTINKVAKGDGIWNLGTFELIANKILKKK